MNNQIENNDKGRNNIRRNNISQDPNKYLDLMVNKMRKDFEPYDKNEIPDDKLKKALRENEYDPIKAFESMYGE